MPHQRLQHQRLQRNRWLAIRLELCGNGIVTGAALTGVVSRQMGWVTANRASLVGLSLTLALAVTNSLGWMVRMSTETEAQMNAVERVTEYAKIESEETWIRSALAKERGGGEHVAAVADVAAAASVPVAESRLSTSREFESVRVREEGGAEKEEVRALARGGAREGEGGGGGGRGSVCWPCKGEVVFSGEP